jgi:hypothetical protein
MVVCVYNNRTEEDKAGGAWVVAAYIRLGGMVLSLGWF